MHNALGVSHASEILPSIQNVLKLEDVDPHQDNHGVNNDNPPEHPHTASPELVAQLHSTDTYRSFNKYVKICTNSYLSTD